jgi:hypothetical protein
LLYQESHRHPPGIATASPQATVSPAVQENSQFAEYVQKSLQNIDQKAQQNAAIAQLPGANGTNGMPTVTIPKTTVPTAGGPGRSTTGLERVYVPIYQLPPNLYPPGTAVAPLPNFPAKANPNSVGGNRSRPFGTAAITPVPRKLVGVLDKGDRSAALFEVNGVTQRYEIGESISSSGWTLVEVTKDQVIIRRNGEVRSVLIGNGF